ncbi:putative jacalin-like lectin domain-containing protein [Plasmopara halstedii]
MVSLFPFDASQFVMKRAFGSELTLDNSSSHLRTTSTRKNNQREQSRLECRSLTSTPFDLPVLLTDLHPPDSRNQQIKTSQSSQKSEVKTQDDKDRFITPKVSRLCSREEEERKVRKIEATVLKSIMRRRHRVRKLGRMKLTMKERLKEKLWKDLSRYGLWPMGDYADQHSVETAVEAIWNQWQKNTERTSTSNMISEYSDARGEDSVLLDEVSGASEISMTGVMSVSSSLAAETTEMDSKNTANMMVSGGYPDFDNFEIANEKSSQPKVESSTSDLDANIQTPGLKRRERLTNLRHFVETQLQKRLFKAQDIIENAFTESGRMTVDQIIDILKHSNVQFNKKDEQKIQNLFEEHSKATSTARDGGEEKIEQIHDYSERVMSTLVFTYDDFCQLFYPTDPQEVLKWKREFEADRLLRQRLENSAKPMIEALTHFRCDPKYIPWESEHQRLQLRLQLFKTDLKSLQSQQVGQSLGGTPHAKGTESLEEQIMHSASNRMSIKLALSSLLQRYSRDGHFDGIDISTAAYLYHDIAADIIKGRICRYRERCTSDQWPERQLVLHFRMKKQTFNDWRVFANYSRTLEKYVLRKFVAWKNMTRKLHEYHAFYRTSFWPFYVWKRHLQQMIIARGKKIFLMNVLQTYTLLRHFRAQKLWVTKKKWNKNQIACMRKRKAHKTYRICWTSWNDRSQKLRRTRQIWQNHGRRFRRHVFYIVRTAFFVLRYFTILRKEMKRRMYKTFLSEFSICAQRNIVADHHHQLQDTYPHQVSLLSGAFELEKASLSQFSYSTSPHNSSSLERETSMDLRNSSILLPTDDEGNIKILPDNFNVKKLCAKSYDSSSVNFITWIMESAVSKPDNNESLLQTTFLNLYMSCCRQDRINMIGNVVAYRRLGQMFMKNLHILIRQRKLNRFASDLGAFRVATSYFHQWMIGTISKATQIDNAKRMGQKDEIGTDSDRIKIHWRKDRQWRTQAIAENTIRAQQLRENLLAIKESNRLQMENLRERELILESMRAREVNFLKKESDATLEVKAAQMRLVQQMISQRARLLYDAIDHVFDVFLLQYKRQQLKSSFRCLRIAVMMQYTNTLCHRAKIRNWLRLCHRLSYWERNMSAFYKLKKKYNAFKALLKHAVWKWKFQSPDLLRKLQRSQELLWKYDHYMETQGVLDGSPESLSLVKTKFSPANLFRGVFLRWTQFAQRSRARKGIVLHARRKRGIWLMHTVFFALNNRVKVRYTFEQRCAHVPYLWRHIEADLDIYRCKIIAHEQRLPTTTLKAQLIRSCKLVRKTAISSPSLKALVQEHEKEVRQRMQLERQLMLVAYEERAVHKFAESSSSLVGTAAGKLFVHDKVPEFYSITEITIISGKRVEGICVVMKAPGYDDRQAFTYGKSSGNREAFTLRRDEKLVSVEGFASQSIHGLRFGTSFGRYSNWFGHCETGSKFDFHSKFISKQEEIIGFFGYTDGASINSLGVVMRHATSTNLFEGLWVQQDAKSQQSLKQGLMDAPPLCDRQFAYFLQVRACEVIVAMKRAHLFVTNVYRNVQTLPPALTNVRIMLAIAKWMFNALSHGLVHCTGREEEGKAILASGQEKYVLGEKLWSDGARTIQRVDGYRDRAGQLDASTLGVKKVMKLQEMMDHAQQQMIRGGQLRNDGQHEMMHSRQFLPYLPTTRRMISTVSKIYKVVQAKDEIDRVDPELRSNLLLEKNIGYQAE